MGFVGLVKFFARRLLELFIIILLVLYLPRIPPDATFSKSYKVEPVKPFEGSLALNEKLQAVEIWHKGDLFGPEAFADYQGELYTSIHGGDIVKLVGNHITPVVRLGKPCAHFHEEHICGRPLGMSFDKNGALFVVDAYYGLFKVDVKTGEKQRLVATGTVIEGRNVTLPNYVVVTSNGDVYWTDSSSQFNLQDGLFDFFADGSGRLLHYDPKTKKNKVLISDIYFANGLALSDDEEFLVISETTRSRLLRYYLKGPKKGTHDIFIDGLPGMTDNVKSDGKGGFLVPLVIAIDDENPSAVQILGPFPLFRKFLSRIFGLMQWSFKFLNDMYPNEPAQRAVHFIGHFTSMTFLTPKRATILHISKEGKIIDSVHSLRKKIMSISEAHIFKDTLYMGSPFNDYIGRISLERLGWGHLKQAPQTQPTTTTPKPTTTTPKPTTTTTTTPKPTTTTTPKPTTTTPKPTTTTTPKPTTTATPKPTTTTPKPTTTAAPKPATTATPTKSKPTTTTPKPTTATPKAAPTASAPTGKTAPKPAQNEAKPQNVKDQPKAVPIKEIPKANKN